MRPSSIIFATALLIGLMGGDDTAQAQLSRETDRYFPLDHRVPGMASEWNRTIHPHREEYAQPVQIQLPTAGLISYFDGSPENVILTQAPSQAGMYVGRTYRVRISGMPEFPGVELFPTIEVLDRLHPPGGREQEFPVPIQFTEEELALAANDQLVTKVVYLEQPQLAEPRLPHRGLRNEALSSSTNLLEAADRRGRAMAVVRMGGRVPSLHDSADRAFFREIAPLVPQAAILKSHDGSRFVDQRPLDRRVTFAPLAE